VWEEEAAPSGTDGTEGHLEESRRLSLAEFHMFLGNCSQGQHPVFGGDSAILQATKEHLTKAPGVFQINHKGLFFHLLSSHLEQFTTNQLLLDGQHELDQMLYRRRQCLLIVAICG